MTGMWTDRRSFLAAVGSAGLVSLAGCSGDGGNGETPTEAQTATPTATPNPAAVDRYESAIETLVATKSTLDEWADSSYESDRVGALQEQVSAARDDLAAAEEAADPSGDLLQRINQATLVADIQSVSLAYYEAVNVFFQRVTEASELGNNELHQRAADTYAEATTVVDDARQVIADMETLLAEIDAETLGEPDLDYSGEPLDHLDLADTRALDAAEQYATANENLHLAFVQFEAGQEHYENESFTDAREAWETGRQRAQDAQGAFEATIDNEYAPENIRQDSIAKLGIADGIIDAYDKFIAGASAAENGNFEEANTLIGEGFTILGELFE